VAGREPERGGGGQLGSQLLLARPAAAADLLITAHYPFKMAKTPSKKTAKVAKAAGASKKKAARKSRTESYSTYIYKVRVGMSFCRLWLCIAADAYPPAPRLLTASIATNAVPLFDECRC
jgi:hypothetical protein